MAPNNLYQELLEEFKDDIDFRVEGVVFDITEKICEIMDEQNITRAGLSRLLDTSKSAVTKMLNGSTNFTLKTLMKIAMVLDKEIEINFNDQKQELFFGNRELQSPIILKPEKAAINFFARWDSLSEQEDFVEADAA